MIRASKVSKQTRERLARLAAERGSTLKEVVEELAAGAAGLTGAASRSARWSISAGPIPRASR
jgi:hypothetical protein